MLANYAPLIVDGLADAALIFFVAVGLTLVFSVLHILNVAHGSFYSLGAYLSVVIGTFVAGRGWPVLSFFALVISPLIVTLALGPLIERTLLRWTYGRSEALQILVTFGLFLILEDAQKLIFGVQSYSQDAPMMLLGTTQIAGIVYLNYQLLLIVLAVLVAIGLRLLLKRTGIGKLIIAVVADQEIARAVGIDASRVFMLAFSLGVFLAALNGALASSARRRSFSHSPSPPSAVWGRSKGPRLLRSWSGSRARRRSTSFLSFSPSCPKRSFSPSAPMRRPF